MPFIGIGGSPPVYEINYMIPAFPGIFDGIVVDRVILYSLVGLIIPPVHLGLQLVQEGTVCHKSPHSLVVGSPDRWNLENALHQFVVAQEAVVLQLHSKFVVPREEHHLVIVVNIVVKGVGILNAKVVVHHHIADKVIHIDVLLHPGVPLIITHPVQICDQELQRGEILILWKLFLGGIDFIFFKKSDNCELFLTLFLSSLPVFIIFGIAEIIFDFKLESPIVLALSMIIFAIILYFCDQKPTEKNKVNRYDSILTGIAQVISLIPGVSRLGACLSMMRYRGYSRTEAFRYSMILSIPPVVGACFLKFLKIALGKIIISNWCSVFIGCFSAFIFGLIILHFVNLFLKKFTLLPLVIYRIFFGILILFQYFFL